MKNFNEFLVSKGISKEQFATKTAEEHAALYIEYNSKKQAELEALVAKGKEENVEEIKALKAEINANVLAQTKTLNESLKEMGLMIKKLSKKEREDSKNLASSIKKALTDSREQLTEIKEKKGNGRVIIKAAGTMLLSSNVSGGNVPVEQRLAGLDALPSRQMRLLDVVSRGSADSNIISWVSQVNKDGQAGPTAEGELKNQIDFDLVVNSESLKKITGYIKVSEEMLNDVSFMDSEIRNELIRELLKSVESQVFGGDGTGNNLNGIFTVATAFAAGTHAGNVDNANEADVLTVAMEQIMLAELGTASHAFVHPSTITTLKLIKRSGTDKAYIDRLSMVAGQLSLDGVQLVPTTLVPAGDYLIGNFPMAKVYDKGEISIEVGRENDDFTKNLVTILGEWRGLVLVKTNERAAFIKGSFATDKAVLETA